MLRLIKHRLHIWRIYYQRGGIGWFLLLKRWKSVCYRYRKIKWGWTSPEYRRDELFEMFHGCPMDFYFNEGEVTEEWWARQFGRISEEYEQWWEDARQVDLLLCSAMPPSSDSPDQHENLGTPRTSRTRRGGIQR